MPAHLPSPPAVSWPLAAPWPAPGPTGVLLMGIVNVTPDSFSDGGHFADAVRALAHAESLLDDGADIVDIGGESTRPQAEAVSGSDEMARILPVITALHAKRPQAAISVDTYKAATAKAALAAGACIVNDVWGLQREPDIADLAAEAGAGLVIMHNRLEKDPALDIVGDLEAFFERSLAIAARAGIARTRIALDPGIGFGKSFEQNLAAIRAIPRLKALGYPVLLGVSRKSFLGLITGRPVDERLSATLAADVMGMILGADILRVHEIGAHRDAIRVTAALLTGANSAEACR